MTEIADTCGPCGTVRIAKAGHDNHSRHAVQHVMPGTRGSILGRMEAGRVVAVQPGMSVQRSPPMPIMSCVWAFARGLSVPHTRLKLSVIASSNRTSEQAPFHAKSTKEKLPARYFTLAMCTSTQQSDTVRSPDLFRIVGSARVIPLRT